MSTVQQYTSSEHWNGKHYRHVSTPQYFINMQFINQFKINGNESVLDIGCGNGDTIREIAKLVPNGKVLGIDASSSMITEAINTQIRNNLSFILMNVHEMQFNEQFDIVTSFFCLQWVQNKKLVFHRICKALRSGGKLIMIAPLPHPHLPQIRKKLIKKAYWKSYFLSYEDPLIYINDNDYVDYANDAALNIEQNSVQDTPVKFKSYDDFYEFMFEMTPHLKQLPTQDLKIKFMHELLDEYLSIYPVDAEGEYCLNFNLQKLAGSR